MTDKKLILAIKLLQVQHDKKIDEVQKAKRIEAIMQEAKIQSIGPNEILALAMEEEVNFLLGIKTKEEEAGKKAKADDKHYHTF